MMECVIPAFYPLVLKLVVCVTVQLELLLFNFSYQQHRMV